MLKQKSVLEVKKGDKTYELHCDSDSPLGEIYDVLHKMFHFVTQKISELAPKQPEKPPEGEVKNEQSSNSNN